MQNTDQNSLISSKEILLKTGISRATLNNYIRLGIIPKPRVMRPRGHMKGVKKIGYFPWEVVARIERVKRLKKTGLSMGEIASQMQAEGLPKPPADPVQAPLVEPSESPGKGTSGALEKMTLHLTVDALSLPAYLLNDRFDVAWANAKAMATVFRYSGEDTEKPISGNVFKWFFSWELHKAVQNWKDLLSLHMAYAKAVKPRHWLAGAFQGITAGEREILEQIYDRAEPIRRRDIHESHLNFLKRDGATESYRIWSMRFREGLLFVYSRYEGFAPW